MLRRQISFEVASRAILTSIQSELAATNKVDPHGASARAINATLEQRPPCSRMFTSPSSINCYA